jgi:hypothetical protein
MNKSPIDELFFELYGFYPNKAGQSFEMIVAAAFKLLLDKDVEYDQRIRGNYSETVYQLDGLIKDENDKSMVEAKDYTLDDRKVGRDDLQKLQGALTDLPVDKGIFASATDFTKPAKKYADSSSSNPMQKQIELFHIRPSTEENEKGRIKKIVVNIDMHILDYEHGKYQFIWTKEGRHKLEQDGLVGKEIKMHIEEFYDKDGDVLTNLHELTSTYPPGTTWEENYVARGTWILNGGHFKYNEQLYAVRGLQYEIAYLVFHSEIVIEGGGNPKIYIKSETGSIDKLITDKDLKKVKFKDGKVAL